MKLRSIFGAAVAAVAIATATPAAAHGVGETVTPHFSQTIPNIPGKSLVALIVDYTPGGASPPHIHAKSAFIFGYVLSGEIESQVNDGPRQVHRAGESFYETPGSRHPVSRNASKTKPAKLLAVFVVDTDEKELTTSVEQDFVIKEQKMSKRLDYNQTAPAGVKALGGVYGYIMQSKLPAVLVDLVYLRISQINNCAYCLDMHTRDLLKKGERIEKLALVQAWREAGNLFDERERAALAWAETVTRVAETNVPDEAYRAARAVFDERELVDLTIAIGLMNAYNRLAISFRNTPEAALAK